MNDAITQPRTGNEIRSPKVASRRTAVRDRLLKVGAQLFSERGISAVSVEEIIDGAGISRATFYGFFANKSQLAVAVLIPVFDSGIAILSRPMPAEPRAMGEQLVDMYLELWAEHRDALLLTGMVDATIFPHIRTQHDAFGVAINKILEAVQEAGLLRNGDAALTYLLLAKTGIPLLRLYQSHPDFKSVYRDSMLALILKNSSRA